MSGVSVLREEGVPERGALRRWAGPNSTWPTRSANLSEHTVSPRSSGRVEICGDAVLEDRAKGRCLACKTPSRAPPPPALTCSSSTAVAPGPSAGCSSRVSCESRKGTCGRRARSAAITPPSANSERLMVRASRRRWALSGSPRAEQTAPAFQARSDPARSTRCSVPAGASEPTWRGRPVSRVARPPAGRDAGYRTCGA